MTVNRTAIATISELVGAVAVVATLGYVAIQIRQNTNAILANSRQTLLEADLGLISDFLAHALPLEIFPDGVELTPENERRFMWRSRAILNLYTGSPEFMPVLTDWLTAARQKAA